MADPKTALGVLLFFPKPVPTAASKRHTGLSGKTTHNQTDHLIQQILESNYGLMTALQQLRGSYNAMIVGQPLENADEILARAEIALKQAQDVVGHVPVTTAKTDDLQGLSQKQLLLFPAV